MLMDQEAKRQIKKLVLDLRHLLEEDLTVVLKRYGIFTDRAWLKPEALPKATPELLETRQYLEAAMLPDLERGLSQARAAALYVREAAFTHLNRLVGLKAIEVRGLFTETIQTRPEYGGRSLYHRDYRAAYPDQAAAADDALPAALLSACGDVARQIRFVFDLEAERSLLWPRYAAIKDAINLINALPTEIWQADEIIGWLYQFYNAEEKKKIRKQGKPSLPIEVAVINQFFTPRWVVKFLVDNTLGRLWLEMHPDSERVRAKCDYLVPEPPSPSPVASQPSPLPLAGEGRKRVEKRPQDIRLIDPACGAMHFGHYAFEVFQEIYRDAREHSWVDEEDALGEAQIPLAILKYNLFGVDIDLRAVQLAALALYLKARTALREAGVSDPEAASLPWQVNLVCADARLTNGGLREKFLKNYADDPALQKAWRELFQEMEDIAQVGSLLRVEERFRQILSAARPHSVEGLVEPRQPVLPGMPAPARQMRLGESQEAGYWTPIRSLDQMLEELLSFTRQAMDEHDINAQVFAAEAEKTLGLLDVLMQPYDIVVMNPPYGDTSAKAQKYLDKAYKNTSKNLYSAFIERALELIVHAGYIGALISRTYLAQPQFTKLRKDIILKQAVPLHTIDLGFGILDDAAVDTCATIIKKLYTAPKEENVCCFYRVDTNNEHQIKFEEILECLRNNGNHPAYYWKTIGEFCSLPNARFLYWAPHRIIELFSLKSTFEPTVAKARQGMSSGNDDLFLRRIWEVGNGNIGRHKKWAVFSKGGNYCKYYYDIDLVILWDKDGTEVKNYAKQNYGSVTRTIKNQDLFFEEGITYPNSSSRFNARYMPPDTIISVKGQGIYLATKDIWWVLGLLNSRLFGDFLDIIHPGKDYQAGDVKLAPAIRTNERFKQQLSRLAQAAYGIKSEWDKGNELCSQFKLPWVLFVNDETTIELGSYRWGVESRTLHIENLTPSLHKTTIKPFPGGLQLLSLSRVLDVLEAFERLADYRLFALQNEIDLAVYDLYKITIEDRAIIERELGKHPSEVVWPQMEGKSTTEKRREHVRRLVSYFLRQALQADADGLLPLTQVPGEPTALDTLRAQMEAFFGEERAFTLEGEISAELGKPLEKWLESDFIPWHTKLYKNRPIIWLLGSPGGTLRALADYHKLRRESLVSLRSMYISRQRDSLRAGLARVAEAKDYKSAGPLEDALADLEVLDQAIDQVLNLGWSPDVDAGVKANILPLQDARLVQYAIK